ncbi:competence/damage-inducible protein A [Abyssalbus ytuae]|uniref:CinA-like protein n=1 Tax=Abyssalbus ytuae TaxID=2926907 RepID=A0A9E6ZSD0_9FLAO|nr:competence/damage-inducible protein A [Abyssalbus ytuae]UOB16978.1 competence/damage-inducible protein A [Abyssalbus ytuae]
MLAEIITIGDEILIGQIVDSNSAFIAQKLNEIGISVYQITSVQDNREHILAALKEAQQKVNIVIITGGLGPTKDDITKHTLCDYFDDKLIQNNEVLKHVEYLFQKYLTTPISDLNRKQALVPSKAQVLTNRFGTAPGMWLEKEEVVFISLPGVPYEMKALMEYEVLPRLQEKFHRPVIIHKTILTYGLGESAIAEKIEDWEDNLPKPIKLAYLPNLGKVRLRLTAKGDNKDVLEKEVDEQIKKLYKIIGDIILGTEENGDTIEAVIGRILIKKGYTLSTAESCTGGKIAENLTSVPGASNYFKGGFITYATEAKKNILGVPEDLIGTYSVVSAEVAEAMAVNSKKLLKTDFSVATTGNAGPSKGDSDAEIGTVFIALATPQRVFSEKFNFGNNRERVINKAVSKAFEMLQKEILKN